MSNTKKFFCEKFNTVNSVSAGYLTLFDDLESMSLDVDLEWFALLAKTGLRDDQKVLVYGVRSACNSDDKLLLPLILNKNNTLDSLATFYTSLYLPLVTKGRELELLGGVFECIRGDGLNVPSINLAPMPYEKPIYELTFNALKSAGWIPFRYLCFGNWYYPVNGCNYDSYFSALPSKLRHTITRKSKRFYKHGGSIKIFSNEDKLDHAIWAYNHIYTNSWKKQEPFSDFMPGLIRLWARTKELRLGVAYIGDVPVAAQVWMIKNEKASIYKLAYDEKYSNLSVGTILSNVLMKLVLDNEKIKEVDYLIGDDSYKQGWMTCRRERWGIVAYNPKTFRGFLGLLNEFVRRFGKKILRVVGGG